MCFSFSRERGRESSRYALSFLSLFGFPSRFETPFLPSFVPARSHSSIVASLSSWLNNIIDIILHDVERPKEDDANEPGKEQLNPFFWPRLETWPHGASASVALARQRSIHMKQFVFSIRDCPLHFEYPTIIHGLVKDSAALCVPCSTSFWHTNRSHTT